MPAANAVHDPVLINFSWAKCVQCLLTETATEYGNESKDVVSPQDD
jgi:hypothetical protein